MVAHDEPYRLSHLQLSDGSGLWIGQVAQPVGARVRARVLARDVSVVREPPAATSILNVLPVVLEQLQRDGATVTLGLRLGHDGAGVGSSDGTHGTHLLARITLRSSELLGLTPGAQLYAQIKGAALMR